MLEAVSEKCVNRRTTSDVALVCPMQSSNSISISNFLSLFIFLGIIQFRIHIHFHGQKHFQSELRFSNGLKYLGLTFYSKDKTSIYRVSLKVLA